MMNADLALKNDAESRKNGQSAEIATRNNDAAFHFIAFMPVGGHIWKLDGLERQPLCIGLCGYQHELLLTNSGSFRRHRRRV